MIIYSGKVSRKECDSDNNRYYIAQIIRKFVIDEVDENEINFATGFLSDFFNRNIQKHEDKSIIDFEKIYRHSIDSEIIKEQDDRILVEHFLNDFLCRKLSKR